MGTQPGTPGEYDHRRHANGNLPLSVSNFVGRETALAEIRRLFQTSRLVTLAGSGGCGKTRLAVEFARRSQSDFPDGTWIADLASVSEPSLLTAAVATSLDVHEELRHPLAVSLAEALKSRHMLLILDNCEHVVTAAAQLAQSLLLSCPRLAILATSREPLAIGGERTWVVPPLSTPPSSWHTLSPAVLAEYEATQLFVDRATAVSPQLVVTENDCAAVTEVCRRLDGLPLAIELAAARMNVMTVTELLIRLDQRFAFLTGGSRLAPPRQQTLRMAIDWSHKLLATNEQALFRRLSVFAGGCTLEAARSVCWEEAVSEVAALDILSSLVSKSLVQVRRTDNHTRYHLLETIREYSWELLVSSGEDNTFRNRHRDWCLLLAEAEEGNIYQGLAPERDNLRAALDWCQRGQGGSDEGLRLACALLDFWHRSGKLNEGRTAIVEFLSRPQTRPNMEIRARALRACGVLTANQGDLTGAQRYFEDGLSLARKVGKKELSCLLLQSLGSVLQQQGCPGQAEELYREGLETALQTGQKQVAAGLLNNLALLAVGQHKYASAEALLQESLQMFRSLEHIGGISFCLVNLAKVARVNGAYQQALDLLRQAIMTAFHADESAILLQCVPSVAATLVARGNTETAATLLGATAAHTAARRLPVMPVTAILVEQTADAARKILGDARFDVLHSKGKALSFSEMVDLATYSPRESDSHHLSASIISVVTENRPAEIVSPHPSEAPPTAGVGLKHEELPLTKREIEVLRLVARGLTSKEIGGILYLSPRTVERYRENIYQKLQVRTLADLVGWCIRHGLHDDAV